MGGSNESGEFEHYWVKSNSKREDSDDVWGGCVNKVDGGVIIRRSDTTLI